MIQNLTSGIMRSFFAKWSFPYNSPFSNISRLLDPISNVLASDIEKTAQFFNIRFRPNKLETKDILYVSEYFGDMPKIKAEAVSITKKDGSVKYTKQMELKNSGDYETRTFSQFPILGGKFAYTDTPVKERHECGIGDTIINKTYKNQCNIYVNPVDYLEEETYIYLYGNNSDGDIITEEVRVLTGTIASESVNKFKVLFKVVSDIEVTVSTYLDTSKYHSIEAISAFPKRFVKNDGTETIPSLEFERNSISIYDYYSALKDRSIFYDVDNNIKSIFLTNNLDVLHIDDNGWLVATKPTIDLSSTPEVNGSMIDEDYLVLDETKTTVGNEIYSTFYPYKFASAYNTTQVKISIENDGNVIFLNKYGQLTSNTNTWIKISDMNDIVRMSIRCDNLKPYVFRITSEHGDYVCSMAYQYESNSKPIIGGISDMFIYNKELIVKMSDGHYVFEPSRMILFKYGDNKYAVDSDYGMLEQV